MSVCRRRKAPLQSNWLYSPVEKGIPEAVSVCETGEYA